MYSDLADRDIDNADSPLVDWLIYFIALFGRNKAKYNELVGSIADAWKVSKTDASFMESGMLQFSQITSYAIAHVLQKDKFSIPQGFELIDVAENVSLLYFLGHA
jgi:hypothetical protein